jgi:hypothetical protein
MKYKKFINDGHGYCIYCSERERDCCCSEKSAEQLGYTYTHIDVVINLPVKEPPQDLEGIPLLIWKVNNPSTKKKSIGVWRKGKTWFKTSEDLVDYHNYIEAEQGKPIFTSSNVTSQIGYPTQIASSIGDIRICSNKPEDYRLFKTLDGYTVLQGYFAWHSSNGGGGEWKEIPTVIENTK